MKTSGKCIECFWRQAEITSGLVKLTAKAKKRLNNFLTRRLSVFDFNQPPVVFGKTIYGSISREAGIKDIFAKEKKKIEKHLIKFAPYLRRILCNSQDPLRLAARFCCAANAIDFGAGRIPDLRALLSKIRHSRLRVDDFSVFQESFVKAKVILIIADNCGEAFFDRLFAEAMLKKRPGLKVYYAVRSAPIINDVLISDAKRIGINKVARLISSGCDYPGIIINKTSSYFKRIYRQADIVISKGQGNFESLSDRRKDIYYVFKIKCPTVSDFLALPLNSLLFIRNKNLYPANKKKARRKR